jgi:hypothetical protein
MNIFVLDPNPKLAAEYHCDKHVVKMILETAQLLSTAHHTLDGDNAPAGIYKRTHANHPCATWARETTTNYAWLLNLGFALLNEYTKRYGKEHKTSGVLKELRTQPRNITIAPMTPFAQAMPPQYKHKDAVRAYRTYYFIDKAPIATWKHGAPTWWPKGAE